MQWMRSSFLAATLLVLVASCHSSSINLVNTPNTTTNDTRNLQDLRDWWCGSTTVLDRNYNTSMQYYYRATRGNFLGDWAGSVIDYLNDGSTTDFIQTMKWPFGLLLTLLCVIFIVWVVFLVFLCAFRKQTRNELVLTGCLRFAKILLFLFIGLYVIILIFMGFSEVSQRHSKCQILNAGNLLINGYVSQENGNQFVGLTAQNQAIWNFQNEYINVVSVGNQGVRIANQNFPAATSDAISRLQTVAASSSGLTTTSPLGFVDNPESIRAINGWFSDAAKVEFSNLNTLAQTLDAAGRSLSNIQNNITNGASPNLVSTVSTLNAFFNNLTADATKASLSGYYQLRNRYTYASGGYWTIFAISIVVIALAIYVIVKLMKIQENPNEPRNFTTLKIILAVLGFLLLCYAIVTIVLLAGSASISTFCAILGNLNQGNWRFVDKLNIKWPGNSQHLLKECTIGKTGDLWNFQSLWPDISKAPHANDIKNIILGVLNYQGLMANPQIKGSSAIAYHIAHFQAIRSGIAYDYSTVADQFDTVYASWTNSSINSGNGIPSLTTYNCSAIAAASQARCQPMDNSNTLSFGADSTYSNFTIVQNLRSYILSEQTTLLSIIQNLQERTDRITPGQAFRNIKVSLDQSRNDVQNIRDAFPSTFSVFNQYKGQAITTFDCRNVRRELMVLEDHYCFELNYWVNILVIIAAISLIILFILCWALCAAIREADTEGEIANFPIPAEENKANINERELIPQA
jgi:hypothetical protein